MKTAVTATCHIRRMREGSQSHLMQCSDGYFYVVKFRNNPQRVRVLANELLGSRLAEEIAAELGEELRRALAPYRLRPRQTHT